MNLTKLKGENNPVALNTLINPAPTRDYQSYLLRMWKEGEPVGWRASLQNVSTQECHYFANMTNLLSFLYNQVGQAIVEFDSQAYAPYRQASRKTPVFQPTMKGDV